MKNITTGELKEACNGIDPNLPVKITDGLGSWSVTDTRNNFGLELTASIENLQPKIDELEKNLDDLEKSHKDEDQVTLSKLKAIREKIQTAYEDAPEKSDAERKLIAILNLVEALEADLQ